MVAVGRAAIIVAMDKIARANKIVAESNVALRNKDLQWYPVFCSREENCGGSQAH